MDLYAKQSDDELLVGLFGYNQRYINPQSKGQYIRGSIVHRVTKEYI